MSSSLATLRERVRIPSPLPGSTGVAFDGSALWVSSWEMRRVCAMDPHTGSVIEQWDAPGRPYGLTTIGDELRVVIGDDAQDDRWIARLIPGHGFKGERIACPDATGSWLAYDGDFLFVGQRFAKRIVEIDGDGTIRREIPIRRETTGMTVVDGCFYLMTTQSKDVDDYQLVRLDARAASPVEETLGSVDFVARGLAFDGSHLWTNIRGEDTLVALGVPGT